MGKVHLALNDGGKILTMSFQDRPDMTLSMETAFVERLITMLGQARDLMKPAVPDHWETGQPTMGLRDPVMSGEPDLLTDDTIIHIRHPGLGWLHFSLSNRASRELGAYLLRRADAADLAKENRQLN